MKFVTALANKYKVETSIRQGAHLDDMTDVEIHFLMSWFVYHLSMDLRRKLMSEHPVLYKKLVNLKEPKEINVPGEQPKIIDRKPT
jgi:hypothetical protein